MAKFRRSDAGVLWDNEDDPDGNVQHLALHGLTPEDVESVLLDDSAVEGVSRSSGRPLVRGYTPDGRWIIVVYEIASERPPVIRPVTAYEPD